jgi:hypothetical protein
MRKTVAFVILPHPHEGSGSTLLRSCQLCELVKPHLRARGIETRTISDVDVDDSVVILNKLLVCGASSESINELKRRGNFVYVDPLDAIAPKGVLQSADVLIASSKCQADNFRVHYPYKQSCYVGHHVDLRIGDINAPNDKLRVAYFGEPYNARFADSISSIIDFHHTNTADALQIAWIDQLRNYNCHYAMRRGQSFDGFKPFTKGFIAAHCAAPVIAAVDDQEAKCFLTPEYPYLVQGSSLEGVLDILRMMRGDFGGPRWRLAVEIMSSVKAASSRDVVAMQLFNAIAPHVAA